MGRDSIEHVIVLILENRSYDHMLGYHPDPAIGTLKDSPESCPVYPDDPDSERIPTEPSADFTLGVDPAHSYEQVKLQLFGRPSGAGAPPMNGFIASYRERIGHGHASRPNDIMRCFPRDKVPVLSALAEQYAVFTHWFASVPGETWPNRNFAHAGTSGGEVNIRKRFYLDETIFERLEDVFGDGAWAVYHDEIPQVWVFPRLWSRRRRNFQPMTSLLDAIENDKLPRYSFIEPNHGFGKGNGNSQHPSNNLETGESFVGGERLIAMIHNALVSAPGVFTKTLFIVTYDEHGGFFDHVPPVPTTPPKTGMTKDEFHFDMTGVRVPAVAISPRIAPGTVLDVPLEHSSIPRTLRAQFAPTAKPLSDREAAAPDILDHLRLGEVQQRDLIDPPPPIDFTKPPSTRREINEFEASLLDLASAVGNVLHMRFAFPVAEEPPFLTMGPMHDAAETGVLVAGSQADVDAHALVAEFHADNS